jgi:3'-5' exoribonuclease
VSFRDSARIVTAMIWSDTTWFADCDTKWQVGGFYKLRCQYFENQYGPQIELERVRAIEPADRDQGFEPRHFYEHTRFDIDEMFAELRQLVDTHIETPAVRKLVAALLEENGELIRCMAAASRNHHAFVGGYLEHVLSVTRTCVYLADKYLAYYPDTQPPLSKSLVIAGAVLHDIGKTLELKHQPQGADYTAAGRLIGHILLGRDLVRDKARELGDIDPETLLRLEHIIVAHQNLPEWGSPVAPHTLEALLVHFADDLDAKYHMMARALTGDPAPGEEFTSRDNPLRRMIFRGLSEK